MVDIWKIKQALKIVPHENLYGLANATQRRKTTKPSQAVEKSPDENQGHRLWKEHGHISPDARHLAYDIASSFASTYKQRGLRLKFSMRRLASAKDQIVAKGLAVEIRLGKRLFLAPTEELYQYLGFVPPFQRNVSDKHSFLILLTQTLIESDPQIRKTGIEVPIGTSGCTVDLVAYLYNGERWAFEITLSSSNVTENAAKLINQGFAKTTFVCRDAHLRKSVSSILRDAGFDHDFFSTIECTIFSTLMRNNRKMTSKGAS